MMRHDGLLPIKTQLLEVGPIMSEGKLQLAWVFSNRDGNSIKIKKKSIQIQISNFKNIIKILFQVF